jgi:dTDP-4-dehydrorhamnose reductase/tetratricopeptide (TPR) repeat protein
MDIVRILVLGGSGMMGSALRYHLPRAGFSVEAPGRDVFDITGNTIANLPVHGFHFVVNVAGLTVLDPDARFSDFLLINSIFPHVLADRCAAAGVKLIQISPESVFDGAAGLYTEQAALNAVDDYGRSKSLGEPARALILRASVLGPEQAHFHNLLCRFLERKGTVSGFRNHRYNVITSLQFARVIETIIRGGMYAHGIRHIPGEDFTHLELVEMIAKAYKHPVQIVPVDASVPRDLRLRTMYPDFARQLKTPPTYTQIQEMRTVSNDRGRWLQVFANHGDLERADQLHRAGRLREAEIAYGSILDKSPNYIPALVNLGVVLNALGKNREAIECYRQALIHDPQNAIIHNNLGNAFQSLGMSAEAATALERAVAINPQYEKAFTNLGDALFNEHRFDEGRAALEKAISLNAENGLSWNRLGRVHARQCRVKEAIRCFRKAVELQPTMAGAHSNVLFTMHFLPDFSPEELAAEARTWNNMHAKPLEREILPHEPRNPEKKPLRVGFVSDCFKRHPVGDFLNGLFREHDRDEMEFVCFSDVLISQPMTEWFKSHSHTWHDIGRMADTEVAELVRKEKIDILIDLAGHTASTVCWPLPGDPLPYRPPGWVTSTPPVWMPLTISLRTTIVSRKVKIICIARR